MTLNMKAFLFSVLMMCSGATMANDQTRSMTQAELIDLIESSHQAIEERLSTPNVFVAVSLSMPKESLLRLAKDAKDARVPLIVRGVPVEEKNTEKPNPSVKEKYGTHILVKGMQAFDFLVKTGVTLQIDPRSFDVFDIKDVPQLILASRELKTGQKIPEFIRVRGDVTLAYALRHVQEELTEKAKKGTQSDFDQEMNLHIDELLTRLGGRE